MMAGSITAEVIEQGFRDRYGCPMVEFGAFMERVLDLAAVFIVIDFDPDSERGDQEEACGKIIGTSKDDVDCGDAFVDTEPFGVVCGTEHFP